MGIGWQKKTDKAHKGSRVTFVPPEERDKSESPGSVGQLYRRS